MSGAGILHYNSEDLGNHDNVHQMGPRHITETLYCFYYYFVTSTILFVCFIYLFYDGWRIYLQFQKFDP